MSKEELLNSIQPGMKVTRAFLLRVYGYSVTDPQFAGIALDHLEVAGCDRALEYYEEVVSQWRAEHDAEIKRAAAWYRQQVEEQRKKEVEICLKEVDKMTEAEAKALLKKMMNY